MNLVFRLAICLLLTTLLTPSQGQELDRAQKIINAAIEAHGGDSFDDLSVRFEFRGKHYSIDLDQGAYTYTRSYEDSAGQIEDVLDNNGFTRKLNGKEVTLSEKDEKKFSNSLNSVCYFTLLPKGLNDPAVKKTMIGINKIDGQKYNVVQVSFAEEGGGDDHDDKYVYWINQKTSTIDFFAYSYHVDGGGVRFRVAKDASEVGGVRFQNYVNYKHDDPSTNLESMPYHYVQGELTKLSEIINEAITVNN